MQKLKLTIISLLFIMSFHAKAGGHEDTCYVVNDPFEPFNRAVFSFNVNVDKIFIRPFVGLYIKATPQWTQDRLHNFFDHLRSPLTLVNNVLQGDGKAASVTFGRFLVNTFFGLGGFLDFASLFDLKNNKQTFDDTLARYGMKYHAYVVLPFMSPTTTRGLLGKAGDAFINPILYPLDAKEKIYYYIADNVDLRIQYHDLIKATEKASVDHYGKVRSMYIQYLSRRNLNCPMNQIVDYSSYDDEEEVDEK